MYIMPLPTLEEVNIWTMNNNFCLLLLIVYFYIFLGTGTGQGPCRTVDGQMFLRNTCLFLSILFSVRTNASLNLNMSLLKRYFCSFCTKLFPQHRRQKLLKGNRRLTSLKFKVITLWKPPNLYISLEKLSQISAIDGWLKKSIVQQKCVSHAGLCLKWWQQS